MKPTTWLLTGGAVAVTAVAALTLSGVVPGLGGEDSARPPCEKLPAKTAVATALADHADLTTRLSRTGSGVRIGAGTPCSDQPDRALISIDYTNDAERANIEKLLAQDSFGIPVQLHKN